MNKKQSLIDRKIETIQILLAMSPQDFQEVMSKPLGNLKLLEEAGLLKPEELPEIPEEEIQKMEAEAETFLSSMSPEEKKNFEDLSDKGFGPEKIIRYVELLKDLKERLKSFAPPLFN